MCKKVSLCLQTEFDCHLKLFLVLNEDVSGKIVADFTFVRPCPVYTSILLTIADLLSNLLIICYKYICLQ